MTMNFVWPFSSPDFGTGSPLSSSSMSSLCSKTIVLSQAAKALITLWWKASRSAAVACVVSPFLPISAPLWQLSRRTITRPGTAESALARRLVLRKEPSVPQSAPIRLPPPSLQPWPE